MALCTASPHLNGIGGFHTQGEIQTRFRAVGSAKSGQRQSAYAWGSQGLISDLPHRGQPAALGGVLV